MTSTVHSSLSSQINGVTTNDRNSTEKAGFLLIGFSGSWKFQTALAFYFYKFMWQLSQGTSYSSCSPPWMFTYKPNKLLPKQLHCCYISVTVPKSLVNSFTHTISISFLGCALQTFFFMNLVSMETATHRTVMSYDSYVATYWPLPLHYEIIVNQGAHVKMIAQWVAACSCNILIVIL